MVSGLIPFIERPQTPANSRFCLDKVATEPPLRASALQLPRSRMARGKRSGQFDCRPPEAPLLRRRQCRAGWPPPGLEAGRGVRSRTEGLVANWFLMNGAFIHIAMDGLPRAPRVQPLRTNKLQRCPTRAAAFLTLRRAPQGLGFLPRLCLE